MQFVVTGHDGTDQEAVARRLAKREEHLKAAEKMKVSGTLKFATALLDDDGKMIGSILVVDFPSREELDQWLKVEPYILGDVWRSVEVKPCRVAPMFQDN
ncbi:MAG: hypothetical protein JSS86_18170 [Cyanobacteria bacterium SZAS LIN-2]|nr:hypothetical protein [Cyanobacteria bacterium SZAS LIN-3]MBS1998259.1 hypothetical protein [Cyanobacteria bacterium SZAS LIN-2]MBS2009555.1 hypothetical protein [Cyanobacteria bacterium SZAS TMP-1]